MGILKRQDLLQANLKRGRVSLLTQDVPRYRGEQAAPSLKC